MGTDKMVKNKSMTMPKALDFIIFYFSKISVCEILPFSLKKKKEKTKKKKKSFPSSNHTHGMGRNIGWT